MKQQVLGSPSGSIGPYVTSRNKAGSYQRNRVIPLNPQTPAQRNVPAVMATIAWLWPARVLNVPPQASIGSWRSEDAASRPASPARR
jgi:hypothetical protein